ncbi:DUF2484 family protein [Acidimangrovimonas sediminis]|uniref:DUF2484 family protein n=1 Tax=Acidimangrovimonas sediminis TaxID=2056283 RepID=UPI0013049233|nr:DUF2484 family protein [Acidimangrovimonas sediminis]
MNILSEPLLWGCLWVLAAAAIAAMPWRFHWRMAIPLMITAVPLVALIFRAMGPLGGIVALAVVASVLRYPLYFGGRRLWRRFAG